MAGLLDFITGGGKGPNLQDAAARTDLANSEATQSAYNLNTPNTITPTGSSYYTPGLDTLDPLGNIVRGRPTLQQSLSPAEQAKLEASQRAQLAGLDILNQSLPNIGAQLTQPFGLTGPQSGVYTGQDLGSLAGDTRTGIGNAGNIQGSLNFQGLPGLVGTDEATRQNVANAQYKLGAQYLDPAFARQSSDLTSVLANQGLTPGSEAYNRAKDELSLQKQRAYSDLTQQSVLAGNTALQQQQQAAIANRQLLGGETQAAGAFANTAQGQKFAQLLDSLQANNAGVAQKANILSTAGQIQNAGQNQLYNQYAANRTAPLNEFNALLSGSQVNFPTFAPTAPVSPIPSTQLSGANMQAQQEAANASANAQVLGSIFGAAGRLSDERLKEDMEKVGETSEGHNVYSYRIFGKPEIGVSAQEVEKVRPELVFKNPFGIRMVNYAGIR